MGAKVLEDLEEYLRRNLDFTRRPGGENLHVVGRAGRNTGRASEVCEAALRSSTGGREVHPIEQVEGFKAELQRLRLRKLEIL